METIQVVLDTKLRKAADLAAKHLQVVELEERDRRGYETQPQREDDFRVWEGAAAWPEDWAAAISTLPVRVAGQTAAGSRSHTR